MNEPLMTTAEVAEMLRVSSLTVRLWVAGGQLKSLRAGKKHRFRRSDVEEFLNRGPEVKTEAAA